MLHASAQPQVIVLAQSAAAVSHTGDTNETTLATITIPGGAMGNNGQVDIEAHWTVTNSANNKTIRAKFGGTAFLAGVLTTSAAAQTHTRIANRNAANSQVGFAPSNTVGFGATTVAAGTAAIDTTADVAITLTAQLASAGETITLESYIVLLRPKA